MKKTTLLLALVVLTTTFTFAQWQKMDLTMSGGGTISNAVNQLAFDNNKLYAATSDGIFQSTSAVGGDWTAYGLQGKRVFLLSFATLKLALVVEAAADDATKKTLQLYKHNGTAWVNTNFNPSKLAVFGAALDNLINFTQIQNGDQTVIIVPTWGSGIWRSTDGGANWTVSTSEPCTFNDLNDSDIDAFYMKVPGVYSFPGDNIVYGTDKPDFDMQYMIYSEDFGITWKNIQVAKFFNPWALHKRKVAGKDYFYWGGKDGNQGVLWRSDDKGANWEASFTSGVEYWDNRRIIGDDDGALYAMCSVNNVYVSTDNGETFAPVGTGITIPATKPAPAGEPFFLTHLIKASSSLYVSTYNDGIYRFPLVASGMADPKTSGTDLSFDQAQDVLQVTAAEGSGISIYSITGKLIQSQIALHSTTTISVAGLQSSVYLVKVISVDGSYSTHRFVKY